jgi:protease-4
MRRLDRILAVSLIILCLIAALGNWTRGFQPSDRTATPGRDTLAPDVALIRINGSIADGGGNGGPFSSEGTGTNKLVKAIRQARMHKVKAILLQVNSPGGTTAASHAIYQELMRTRKESDVKIIAQLGDVAASGGYYVASAANHIVADPSTITGSIGVIVRTQNISPLMDKIGVKNGTVQSGKFKDILSPFRDPTADEKTLLEGMVSDSYQQFLEAIAQGRGMPIEKIKPLADGRIFNGSQALELKLVDSLGNYYDAIEQIKKIAGIEGEPTIQSYPATRFPEALSELFSTSFNAALEEWLPGYHQARSALRWERIPLSLME